MKFKNYLSRNDSGSFKERNNGFKDTQPRLKPQILKLLILHLQAVE